LLQKPALTIAILLLFSRRCLYQPLQFPAAFSGCPNANEHQHLCPAYLDSATFGQAGCLLFKRVSAHYGRHADLVYSSCHFLGADAVLVGSFLAVRPGLIEVMLVPIHCGLLVFWSLLGRNQQYEAIQGAGDLPAAHFLLFKARCLWSPAGRSEAGTRWM